MARITDGQERTVEEEKLERQIVAEDFEGDDDYELDRPSRRIARLIFIVGGLIVIAFLVHYFLVEAGAG